MTDNASTTGVAGIGTSRSRDANQVIATVLDDLLRTMRTQVLLRMVRPYSRLGLPFISAEIGVPVLEVERLVAALILDKRIDGRIDQVSMV